MARSSYIRGIDDAFINDLKNEDGKLFGLMKMLKNKAFQMEIRENYLNIYYKGGNLFKVVPKVRRKEYVFEFDTKYLDNESENRENKSIILELCTGNQIKDIDGAIRIKDIFCAEMDCWFLHRKSNKEREIQQKACLNNRPNDKGWFLVDIEYARTGFGRADMLFVKNENGQFKVYIVELKQGNGAISSVDSKGNSKSGLYKHYLDAVKLVNTKELFESIKNNIMIRKSLGEKFFSDVEKPILNEKVEFVIALYGYRQNNKQDKDKLENEIRRIEKAKSTAKLDYCIKMLDENIEICI